MYTFWYVIQHSQWQMVFFCDYVHPGVQRYMCKDALLITERPKTVNSPSVGNC